MKMLKTASLGPNFTGGSYKKECIRLSDFKDIWFQLRFPDSSGKHQNRSQNPVKYLRWSFL